MRPFGDYEILPGSICLPEGCQCLHVPRIPRADSGRVGHLNFPGPIKAAPASEKHSLNLNVRKSDHAPPEVPMRLCISHSVGGISPKRCQTITFHFFRFALVRVFGALPAKYSLLFKLFQLPMCRRSAICRIVRVVSFRKRSASASFTGWRLGSALYCDSFRCARLSSSAMIRSAL